MAEQSKRWRHDQQQAGIDKPERERDPGIAGLFAAGMGIAEEEEGQRAKNEPIPEVIAVEGSELYEF